MVEVSAMDPPGGSIGNQRGGPTSDGGQVAVEVQDPDEGEYLRHSKIATETRPFDGIRIRMREARASSTDLVRRGGLLGWRTGRFLVQIAGLEMRL
jgi:hypothetical protein